MSKSFKSKLAFTLAEVLIVLGIIGIIAEMTIPTLMNDVQNKSNIVAWKKAYTVLSQAFLSVKNDTGPAWVSPANMRDSFLPYFRVLKKCDVSGDDCWHAAGKIKTLPLTNGTQYTMSDQSGQAGLVTADGMKVIFCLDSSTKGWAMVDVNGDKNPNVVGKDVFGLRFDGDVGATSPFSPSEMGTCVPPAPGSAGNGYIGLGCSQYYILNG